MTTTAWSEEQMEASRAYHRRREAALHEAREARRLERLAAARQAIRDLAPTEPTLSAVYLFGSILHPGRFLDRSDLDVAVDGDDPAAESRLWRALEETLQMDVDLRPRRGAVAWSVERGGERVYEREDAHP